MQTQTQPSKEITKSSVLNEGQHQDAMRTMAHSGVMRYFIHQLREIQSGPLSTSEVQGPARGAFGQLKKLEESLGTHLSPTNADWMHQAWSKDILWSVLATTELLMKIGTEEDSRYYQEFTHLLIELVRSVLFFKDQRRNIHFGKYRKLFQLISDELKTDAVKQPGRFTYLNGKLEMRLEQVQKEVIK
jgi:hypothetical protein